MADVPLTNQEAEALVGKIQHQGGVMHDEVRCPRCRNYTLGDVAYKGYKSRRIKYATICLSCDSVKSWPRMEVA